MLALALAQCTWMKLSVLEERLISLTVLEALLSAVLLSIHMQEYDVKVCSILVSKSTEGIYDRIKFCSKCQWKLYLWRCSSGGRFQSV